MNQPTPLLNFRRFSQYLVTSASLALSSHAFATVTAGDDSASTTEGTSVQIAVLANDTAQLGNAQVVATDGRVVGSVSLCLASQSDNECSLNEVPVNISDPSNGSIGISNDGLEIIYTPNGEFTGTDSFRYALYQQGDGEIILDDAADALVTITVNAEGTVTPPTEEDEDLADAVNSLCEGSEDSELTDNCTALNGLSEEDQIDALTTISADQVTAEFTTTVSMAREQNSNLLSRLSQIRQGATGFNIAGLKLNTESGQVGGRWLQAAYETMAHGGPETGGAAGDEAAQSSIPFGFFINGSISTGEKDSNTLERGYDLDADNFTMGADYRFSDSLVAGAALGVSSTEIEFNSTGDTMENDGTYLFFYGSWFQDNFNIDTTVGFASGEIDTARRIFIPMTLDTIATGQTDTSQLSLQIAGSYDFNIGALTYGPYARIDIIEGEIDAYQEANGGGFEVAFDKQDIQSRLLTFGGQANYVLSYDWGVLVPSARFELKNEFEDEQDAITGRFILDPNNTSFSITADEIDNFWFQSGVGASAVFPYGFSAYVDYETMFGLDSLSLNTYSFGGRWELNF